VKYKIVNKNRAYGVSDKIYKTLAEAKEGALMESASTGGIYEVIIFDPIESLYKEIENGGV